MALFLGTWNVPTDKKLRVNNTLVTEVYSNGTLVWKYKVGTGPGGLPTAGAKGHWVATGKLLVYLFHRNNKGVVTAAPITGSLGYGEKQGALVKHIPDSGASPTTYGDEYAIMRWVPA